MSKTSVLNLTKQQNAKEANNVAKKIRELIRIYPECNRRKKEVK